MRLLHRLREMYRDFILCWCWMKARRRGLPERRGELDHRFTIHLAGPEGTNKLRMWGKCSMEEACRLTGFLGIHEDPTTAIVMRDTVALEIKDTNLTLGSVMMSRSRTEKMDVLPSPEPPLATWEDWASVLEKDKHG